MMFTNFETYKKQLTILPKIDFNASWTKVITDQRLYLCLSLLGEIIVDIFRPLAILILGWTFSSGRLDYFFYLFLLWVGMYGLEYVSRLCNYVLQLRVVYSIHYQAHQWFLQADPIYHAHRSSGAILGKIDRASTAYQELFDAVFFDMIQTVIGIITVIIYLSLYNLWLGSVAFCLLSIIMVMNILITKYIIIPQEKKLIKADDRAKSVSVENLAQITLIRTCFASKQVDERLHEKETILMRQEGHLWYLFNLFYAIIKITYLFSVFVLSWYIFNAIQAQMMTGTVGLALLFSYIRGTYEIVRVEKPLRAILKSTTRIQDLFSYMKIFGRQSFPVLSIVPSHCRMPSLLKRIDVTITGQGLVFDYNNQTKIFDNHNFSLTVPGKQENKLYGIIGPSGIGKSTLVSILGGQLKPTKGLVCINDVDIYQVDDAARSQLVALQGQVSSNIRGTLKSNLFFGLPKEKEHPLYSDEQLTEILQKVGLWELFAAKKGLETFIGEGGHNLSGGQRQRLNFANLFLRARYYKPGLILIDEPTSSLDEVSEKAITDMILSLAQDAITLVIAHRLATINDAVGILDFSLLAQGKEIRFDSHDTLLRISPYYQRLMSGIEELE